MSNLNLNNTTFGLKTLSIYYTQRLLLYAYKYTKCAGTYELVVRESRSQYPAQYPLYSYVSYVISLLRPVLS